VLLDSEPETKAATPEGLALYGFWEKCYNAAPDGRDLKVVAPEFLAVGIAITAFLTGSVKGGGFKLRH
jgi:hypothetical protein